MVELIVASAVGGLGEARRAALPRRSVPRLVMAALALGLGASCWGPPAVVQDQAAWQAPPPAYPPKPPPKPRRPVPVAAGAERAYTVARGDTVYGIARRHGVPIRTLIEANRLHPPYLLRLGQKLVLHERRHHTVGSGETVYAISRLYGVDMHSLARLNGLRPPYTIATGRRLLLPGSVAGSAPPREVATAAPPPAAIGQAAKVRPPAARGAPAPPAVAVAAIDRSKIPRPPPRSANTFVWPVQGKIVSGFGSKPGGLHNDGINIAGPRGAPVRAAGNGVVAYAGNELRGYGNLLLVRHAGGWTTAYAHIEAMHVHYGDTVRRGQVIGRLGSTGHVTAPQLHFEIRRGRKAVDPLLHLGPRPSGPSLSRAGRRAVPPDPG